MKRQGTTISARTGLPSVGMLLLWLMAVAHCTADCCSDEAHFYSGLSRPAVAGTTRSHQANQPGHHDHCFCDSLHSVCPIFPSATLVRPDFGLAAGVNFVAPARPLILASSETLIRRQPPDRHWTFTPEVCLGPALYSLAPPVSPLS